MQHLVGSGTPVLYIGRKVLKGYVSPLRPLSSRTEHSRLVVPHCRNSSVVSLPSALLALFRCACVSYFSILVQFI
jgi:hypothetical protein